MFGIHMRFKEDSQIRELIENEWVRMFEEERDSIRHEAKEKISIVQQENVKNFNKKRKKVRLYKEGDLVATKRTQLGLGLKFKNKFLGPYCIVKEMRNDRYIVSKIGSHEDPQETSTLADHMKRWLPDDEESEETASEYENENVAKI